MLALKALALLLASGGLARAEPISLAILSAVGINAVAGSFAAVITTIALTAAVSVGLNFVTGLLRKPAAEEAPRGVQEQVQFGGDVPRQVAIGKVATKGHFIHWNTYGSKHQYVQLVFVLSEMQCQGLNGVWVDGTWHALNPVAIPGGNTEHARFEVDGFGDRFIVRFFDGRYDQSADKELVDEAEATASGFVWTSNKRLRGCCYVSVTLKFEPEYFPAGTPDLLWELSGAKLYDPRFDTTVGGSGPQRFNNPATWVFSENPAVGLNHYRRGFFLNGVRVCGMGWPAADISTAHTIAAANICDETATLEAGGTEPRYRVSLVVKDDVEHWQNVHAFHQAMAGFEAERGGITAAIAGAAQLPALTITDDDLVVGKPVRVSFQTPRDQTANAVTGTYTEPKEQWGSTPYESLYTPAWEAQDGDEKLPVVLDLPMVASKTQAERIRSIRANETRMKGRGTLPVRFSRLAAQAGDVIRWNSARYGDRRWQLMRRIIGADHVLYWEISETAAAVYSAAGLPLKFYRLPPTRNLQDLPTTVAGFLVAATTDVQGGVSVPCITATWTAPGDRRVKAVILEYRMVGTLAATRVRDNSPEDGSFKIHNVVPGRNYEERATIDTVPARFTTWTAWTPATAPSANPYTIDVEADLAETNAALDQSVVNAAATANAIRDFQRELMEQLAADAAGEASIAWLAREDVRVELRANYRDVDARLVSEQIVRASETSALAADLLALSAEVAGIDTTAVATLSARVDVTEAEIDVHSASILTLDSRISGVEGVNDSQASTLVSYGTRITAAEGVNTSQASALVSLDSRMTSAEGTNTAQASSISSLNSSVTSINGTLSSHASSLTSLTASYNDISANALFSIAAAADQTGASIRIAFRMRVNTGSAFFESGLYGEIVGGVSRWMVLADKFIIASAVGGTVAVPFMVTGGAVHMQNVNISGSLVVTGSIDTPKLAANAVTNYVWVTPADKNVADPAGGGPSWGHVADLNINPLGRPVKITVSFTVTNTTTSAYECRVRRGLPTPRDFASVSIQQGNNVNVFVSVVDDDLLTGSQNYRAELLLDSADRDLEAIFMDATVLKK